MVNFGNIELLGTTGGTIGRPLLTTLGSLENTEENWGTLWSTGKSGEHWGILGNTGNIGEHWEYWGTQMSKQENYNISCSKNVLIELNKTKGEVQFLTKRIAF